MSVHGNVDLGHTVAGWTGTTLSGAGFCVAGFGIIQPSGVVVTVGVATMVLAMLNTWTLHLVGWGKPSGPRPPDQWDWRVRDLAARQGHPNCVGCKIAGRRTVRASGIEVLVTETDDAPSYNSVAAQTRR
jgi:hypothetical protein